jgi:NitT/TauT family transport system substrate-binding protein
MTSQPTAGAVQTKGVGYTAMNLATTSGAEKWLGGAYPAAGVLAQASWVKSHQKETQAVVDALVATMHWIATHSAAQIADAMPPAFVSNGLTTKAAYISELAGDKGQFLPDGMMPASGPQTVYTIEKFIGNAPHPISLAGTYTNSYVIAANKLEGFTK